MWLIDNNTFLKNQDVTSAKNDLSEAVKDKNLTLILGNGLSQSAEYEHNPGNEDDKGWERVVVDEYNKITGKNIKNGEVNSLILAEAVINKMREKNEPDPKGLLLEKLNESLSKIKPSVLHKELMLLKPSSVITTNYDYLIEKTLLHSSDTPDWCCYVGDAWKNDHKKNNAALTLFKMHGTFEFDNYMKDFKDKYILPEDEKIKSESDTVVISEQDYDKCLNNLYETKTETEEESTYPFWSALQKTILIIGKGPVWEDLSFMYTLRERARQRRKVKIKNNAYWLLNSISKQDKITLKNLDIIPIVTNMPKKKEDGHYYFSTAKALSALFEDNEKKRFDSKFSDDKADLYDRWVQLTKAPSFVAIGLSAHNTTGKVLSISKTEENKEKEDNNVYIIPKQGRRNMSFHEAEEYAGGSALTAIGVFSSLILSKKIKPHEYHTNRAIISVIGGDFYGKSIGEFCNDWQIDSEGIHVHEKNTTWRSTVLVHDIVDEKNNTMHKGQRIFLDRKFKIKAELGNKEQFDNMISSNNLKVIYLDKWLAQQDDFKNSKYLKEIKKASEKRVCVLYETGGGGSDYASIEKILKPCIDVLTTGFPFFMMYIIPDEIAEKNSFLSGVKNVEKYNTNNNTKKVDYGDISFSIESDLINDTVNKINDGKWHDVPISWIYNARSFLNGSGLKWMIVTLHDKGALAFDFRNKSKMMYFPIPKSNNDSTDDKKRSGNIIKNTAGAGDTFRGAFCFALHELVVKTINKCDYDVAILKKCTEYAVMCSSERCKTFAMNDVLVNFKENGYKWFKTINSDLRFD